ncbi:MAG: hypothetical protein DMG19_06950 [Acidobacteria bacterium]|nr:MAG: hypothetical protein DMG19_06950 [Acidobacteriota bacterium]
MAENLRPSPGAPSNDGTALSPQGEGLIDGIPLAKVVRPESIEDLSEIIANEKGKLISAIPFAALTAPLICRASAELRNTILRI